MGFFKAKTKFVLPSYIEKPTVAISNKATGLLDKGFQSYDKPLTAEMNETQTNAMDWLQQIMGPPGSTSSGPRVIDDIPGASGGPAGTTQDYMNPYLENAMEPLLRRLGVQNKQNLMDVDAKANMAGAFGDTGHAIERAETTERGNLQVEDAATKAYSDAFNSAMGLKSDDLSRMMSGKTQSAQLLNQLFGMGTQQQQTEQQGMNADFSEFLREQGFDEEQLAKISSIIGSLQQGTAQTSPSKASSLVGGISAIGSLIAGL